MELVVLFSQDCGDTRDRLFLAQGWGLSGCPAVGSSPIFLPLLPQSQPSSPRAPGTQSRKMGSVLPGPVAPPPNSLHSAPSGGPRVQIVYLKGRAFPLPTADIGAQLHLREGSPSKLKCALLRTLSQEAYTLPGSW